VPTRFVEILDTEEKGSDVNLAVHIINDAWSNHFDVALVLSQDTDLIEPLRSSGAKESRIGAEIVRGMSGTWRRSSDRPIAQGWRPAGAACCSSSGSRRAAPGRAG
jgi:uncharacterized LabA/DUF88 family protein